MKMDHDCPYDLWYEDLPPTLPDAEHTYMMGSVQYYMKLQVARKEIDDMSAKQMKIAAKMEEVQSRWTYVREKLTRFKEIIIKCNDYILNNDMKRWQAEGIYKEQHKLVLEKVAEIRRLNRTIAALLIYRDNKKVASFKCLTLQTKIEESLFKSLGLRTMDSILKRNESLNITVLELQERMEKGVREFQKLKAEKIIMCSNYQTKILQLGIISADLFMRYVDVTNDVFYFTGLIDRFMFMATQQDIEIGHIRYVTFTLYRTICMFQRRDMLKEETEEQLPYISLFMKTHTLILREFERETAAHLAHERYGRHE